MIKIFTCEQIKDIDRYTIENEPVSSCDLMERAAGRIFEWIASRFNRSENFMIFTGPGNNGGDGLVLARLLWYGGYKTRLLNIHFSDKYSEDFIINRKRIEEIGEIPYSDIMKRDELPVITEDDVVIDAIFGSGISRPADGLALDAIKYINDSAGRVIAIDMPSGLFGEDNSRNNPDGIIRADVTLSLQFPKLSFMFADCFRYTGEWHILSIGLHPEAIRKSSSSLYLIEIEDIAAIIKTRRKFDHKGIYGHGLLVAGSRNKTGAAILSARAALRTGIGLITCHTSSAGTSVIQTALPEAMTEPDKNESIITDVDKFDDYTAIAAGPGMGTSEETCTVIYKILSYCNKPLVLDADAINILGLNRDWLKLMPAGTVLTPHKKEFERITGKVTDDYSRLVSQVRFSGEYNSVLILKGAHTSVSLPDGRVFFNNTGNPGMATAGSGDVLTGIILSLLAQGYSPEEASIAGVFIHGLAGDIAAEKIPAESIIASDITDNIGNALNRIKENRQK